MTRKHIVRRGVRTNFAKYRQPAWDPRIRRARKMKRVVVGQKQTEHFGAADDGNYAVTDPEPGQRCIEAGADRVPQQSIWLRGIWRKRRDLTGEDQTVATRGTRSALVRMAAMHEDRGVVERVLEEALIGVVADRRRHFAFAVRDNAVGGNDHIAFDAAHG